MAEQERVEKSSIEYILVSNKDSKVILSTVDRDHAKSMAKTIRQAGGEVTIFRSLSL